MNDCIFCKIVNKEIPAHIIGETEEFLCFLDLKPITEGHALIVPKRHFKDLSEFPEELDKGYFAFVQEMVGKIIPAVGADGYNIGMNNGKAAGQVIFHQHTHLIPRYDDDGLTSWPHNEPDEEALVRTKARILGKA